MSTHTPSPATPWQDTLHHLLWKASQAMHRTLNEQLSTLGITINQLALAATLDNHAPLSAADLARIQGITPQTVNTALGQVDSLGWLERRPHPVHKRVVLLELTATGRDGVKQGRAITDAISSRMFASLDATDHARVLTAALRRITTEFDDPDVSA